MKIVLFDVKPASSNSKKCINKDLAGGMGTGTWIGNSLRARIFEWVKRKNVVLPVLTTAYLASIFKKAGWEVEVASADENFNSSNRSGDLALVSTSIVDCHNELEVIKVLRKNGFYVGAYGAFASSVPDFFAGEADFVIKGEPEAGALKIISEKELPRGVFEVEPIKNLDKLPFPDWSYFPINKYSYFPALTDKPVVLMLASRGCPYSCAFYCAYPLLMGRKWRARSVDNIIGEIEFLKNNYGIRAIDFRDPVFTLDRERARSFAESLLKKNIKISWSCETRLDCLDKDLLKVMRQAGLKNINVGIESYDSEILKKSNRLPVEQKHQEEIISFCRKLGITMAAFYILGLENDTEENIKRTINYAKSLNTLVAQFAINTPYPGTALFDKLKEEGNITNFEWENYDEYTPVFRHKFLSQQKLLDLKEEAFVSYYFRPSYLLRYMPIFLKKFL
ncbi:MAG: hypothetical protein Athens071424_159 [Parcubacteria group bacterium Athens0714_24]|nr:MAG: hypothetical protein Athens071424_159 [Parcubacteria group bacterium Athens0714_24]